MQSRMQAKGLSAGYNGKKVFRELNLDVPEGKITTLIGSNASFLPIPDMCIWMGKQFIKCRQKPLHKNLHSYHKGLNPPPASR